jgi:hypothetical protein
MTERKQIRHTKKLDAVFRRCDVQLRKKTSTVVHAMTGKVTDCAPLIFAVYEAAIKSAYISNALHPSWPECCEAGHDRHYMKIAREGCFDLPDPVRVPEENREIRGKQGTADYRYCISMIARAGLYYELMD